MTDTRWWTDYWPWWVAFLWLGGFEVYAWLATKVLHVTNPPPGLSLLSYQVWDAFKRYPWAPWIAMVIVIGLLLHFYARPGEPFPKPLLVGAAWIVGAWIWHGFHP